MAQAYFIGGAARTGKSTLALKAIEHYAMPHGATDSIRTSLRLTTTPQETPDLFYLDSLNVDESAMAAQMRDNTAHIIAAADRESLAVWPAVVDFVETKLATGQSVLVEGIGILPGQLKTLAIPYSAVFLGNLSPEHETIVQNYARHHPDTWLGSLRPDTIGAFAHFVRAYSKHSHDQAGQYKLPFINMGAQPFQDGLSLALTTLFKHSA